MQKIFLKWRARKLDTPENYGDFTLNGGYTITFEYNKTREWYINNAGVNILDQILNEKYCEGKDGNARKDKLMAIVEFDETKITADELAFDLENQMNGTYGIKVLTIDETKAFLNNFTTCDKTDNLDGTFTYTIREEETLEGVTIPAYLLTL